MFTQWSVPGVKGGRDSCLSVRYGSASAVRKVELLSFIPRHGSRYQCLLSFLVQIKKMNWVFFHGCRINYVPYGCYWSGISARNVSKSLTTLSNDGLASGSWFQHLTMSCQHCSGNTSNLSGVLLSTAFIMSITRGRKWRFIFCGWLPWPSHTRQSNIPNAYTSMDLSYCCFIISGAMLIGVPTNELQMRPSDLQRPRSVNFALFFSSN